MKPYLDGSSFYDREGRLSEEEKSNPFLVLDRFTSDYRLEECRYLLWAMLEVCMTTDNSFFAEPEERADLLTQVRNFLQLVEAGYLLVENRRALKGRD